MNAERLPDLSGLHAEARQIVEFAAELGWRIRRTASQGNVLLSSAIDPRQTINLGSRGDLNRHTVKTHMAKLRRYSDPARLEQVMRAREAIAASKAPSTFTTPTKLTTPRPTPPIERKLIAVAATILSERPWQARAGRGARGSGSYYDSKVVVERRWSDGHVDYRCSVAGCGFSNDRPQSVRSHYGRTSAEDHPNLGDDGKLDERYAGPSYEPAYTRDMSSARIDRLARELAAALADVDLTRKLDATELAYTIAERVVAERVNRGDSHDDHGADLTPEQIIERVRRLIDDGSHFRAIERADTLTRELREASERLTAVEQQLIVAKSKADEFDALRAIVSSYDTDTKAE